MTHIEKQGEFSPVPYKGWTLCGELVSTRDLVGDSPKCTHCLALHALIEASRQGSDWPLMRRARA